MKEKIKELQKKVEELEKEILTLAGWKVFDQAYFSVVGTWDCDESLCGLCCYDHYRDPVHDLCVYCGEPEERK